MDPTLADGVTSPLPDDATLQEYVENWVKELVEKTAVREAQRARNLAPDSHRPSPGDVKKLDSSIKKNSAFVKKLRTSLYVLARCALRKSTVLYFIHLFTPF